MKRISNDSKINMGVRERESSCEKLTPVLLLLFVPTPWGLGTFIQRLGTASVEALCQVMGEITNLHQLQVALAEAYEIRWGGVAQ